MRNPVRKIALVGPPQVSIAESLRELGFRVDAVPGESTLALAHALYGLKPAVIHARTAHLRAAMIARVLDLPLIVEAGRDDISAATAYAARMAERTLCAGAAVREALIELGAPPSSTVVARSLIGVESEEIGHHLLEGDARWVVCVSPLDGPDRGHHDLLLAFLSLARTRPKLKLFLGGEGAEARRLRAVAAGAGLGDRVVVQRPSLQDLPGLLQRAAVVVGPSRSGSHPDSLPEALAVGAAVIATAVGPHPTWVREGRTGWLVPPRAPVALASRLAHALDDPEGSRRIGEQARAAALECAAPRLVAQELARCYAAVCRQAVREPIFTLPPAARPHFQRA